MSQFWHQTAISLRSITPFNISLCKIINNHLSLQDRILNPRQTEVKGYLATALIQNGSPPVITDVKSCVSYMKCRLPPTFSHSGLKSNFAITYNAARCEAKHTKMPDVYYFLFH